MIDEQISCLGWQETAVCYQAEDSSPWDVEGNKPALAEIAKAGCARCPVLQQCRARVDAMEGAMGYAQLSCVYAGETPQERVGRRRRENRTLKRLEAEGLLSDCERCERPTRHPKVLPDDAPGCLAWASRTLCATCAVTLRREKRRKEEEKRRLTEEARREREARRAAEKAARKAEREAAAAEKRRLTEETRREREARRAARLAAQEATRAERIRVGAAADAAVKRLGAEIASVEREIERLQEALVAEKSRLAEVRVEYVEAKSVLRASRLFLRPPAEKCLLCRRDFATRADEISPSRPEHRARGHCAPCYRDYLSLQRKAREKAKSTPLVAAA